MNKIIVVGDIHGRSCWKLIKELEKPFDKFIFIGDYFDTHESFTPIEQMKNFEEIIEFKKEFPEKVVLLIGNHDHHYFPEIGYTGTSGYQSGAAKNIELLLDENRQYLQMAYEEDGILFTHAGVSNTFLKDTGWDEVEIDPYLISKADYLNNKWKDFPHAFIFYGRNNTGDDITQTPIWIRPRSLMKDSKKLGVIQVVGHTQQKQIDIEGKATGGKYYFIDTLGTSNEYLIIEDGEFRTNKWK